MTIVLSLPSNPTPSHNAWIHLLSPERIFRLENGVFYTVDSDGQRALAAGFTGVTIEPVTARQIDKSLVTFGPNVYPIPRIESMIPQ